MQSSSCRGGVTGIGPELFTRTSLFSTRYAHALQVRDLDFVKRGRRVTYLGTGADSRVGLASAPAMKLIPLSLPPHFLRAPRPAPRGPRPASV